MIIGSHIHTSKIRAISIPGKICKTAALNLKIAFCAKKNLQKLADHYHLGKNLDLIKWGKRMTCLTVGILLFIPLINLVAFAIISSFNQDKLTQSSKTNSSSKSGLSNKKNSISVLVKNHHYEYHAFHDQLHKISKAIVSNKESTDKDLIEWQQTLSDINGAYIKLASNRKYKIDLTEELKFLKNPKKIKKIKIEHLTSKPKKKDWEQILKIGEKSFSEPYSEQLMKNYISDKNSHIIIATDVSSKKIIGSLLWREINSNFHNIDCLARAPEATGMSIGSSLMRGYAQLAEKMGQPEGIILQVRPDNTTAQNLYKKTGFSFTNNELSWQYKFPTEQPKEMFCVFENMKQFGKSNTQNKSVKVEFAV